MVTKKPINWFLTERGRKFSFAFMTTSGIALTAAKFLPQTLFLTKYQEFVQYYKNGKPVDLPDDLMKKYQACLTKLKTSEVHKKLITPFSVFGFDLFHAGSGNSKFGIKIGIPLSYTYKSIADIEKDDIQVNQRKVDWNSEVGKKLADSLILPEKVQQFAICREILMTLNNKVFFESTYPFICIFFAYNLSVIVNEKFNLHKAHRSVRGILYAIVGMFSIGTYFLLKDVTEVYYETEVDKKLCELGHDFIESGVIFYDKLLKRNQALRELMGSEGKSKYSKLGNENFGLRQPRIALVHRKSFFEEKLKEISEKSQSE